MLFKCKICGGELNIQKGQSIVECEYCGVKQTLPRFLDENTKLMYDRANSYLLHNEFDKAENIYNQILLADKEDADAYWNLVLCKYGVTYVKDPASGKYIPTCNRTHYASVFNDENYKNAIQYADTEKAELYRQDAKTIDDIQQGILSISKHEKPFDIFISYKETGENGSRTKDSIKAQELYDKLTAEGYKVFFSRITLEDKIGTEYEPYIYAALASSKVMLVIGSSKENLDAVWVKNEWSRYLSFVQRDSEKTLIPLYFGMDKADLPDEFAHLTAYDMAVDGFEQELIRGIKKLIPLPIMLLERRKKFHKKLKIAGIAVLALAVIGGIASIPWFMKLPDYNAAMQLYYDKNYPEATWAFADLGSYRNSAEMKDKCERSWRHSLATVTMDTWEGAKLDVSYYIDTNGSMQTMDNTPLNSNLKANTHGKIASLAPNNKVNVLYDDGYVSNILDSAKTKDEWHNIIKLSGFLADTTIALRSDGQMLYDTITDGRNSYGKTNEWMEPIKEWKDIVSFQSLSLGRRTGTGFDGTSYDFAMIVGLKADGTLESVIYDEDNEATAYPNIFSEFRNVNYFVMDESKFIALTKDNTIITAAIYEIFEENKLENVIELYKCSYPDNIYILNNEANLLELDSGNILLKDIVHINGDYAISRNGNIYELNDINTVPISGVKVQVYDEWLERMK